MSSSISDTNPTNQPNDQLIQLISPWLAPLGYQPIHIEIQSHRQKVLRIYIDRVEDSSSNAIGIEDCVKATKALDEKLDQSSEVQNLLPGAYELEVSSPGADRPLRSAQDYQRFTGHEVRIHLYRPLNSEEIENPPYQQKNPKQKNFLGTLVGLKNNKVVLSLASQDKNHKKSGKKSKTKEGVLLTTNSVEGLEIKIPLPLISKANLEPYFDFEASNERESHEL